MTEDCHDNDRDTDGDGGGGCLQPHLLHFTGQKAGMSQIDTDRVHRVIYEASKDSAYYQNQQRQAERVSKQLEEIKSKIGSISDQERQQAFLQAERNAERLRHEMCLDRTWICVDLDMFYAAVAIRDNPDLIDKPVAVGDLQMISTASYVARRFGVRSAMPGFIAVKLCPDLIFVKPDFAAYQAEAVKFRAIFADYDLQYTSWSLDEAAMDVTDYIQSHSDRITGEEIGREIRQRIFEVTKLTASCGIACNQMLAKICSDINKPNGQYCLSSDRQSIETFINDLPPRKIPGIGRVTERILQEIGIKKCGDFSKQIAIARRVFTPRMVEWLTRVMVGIGRAQRSESDFQPRKSYSVSRTFSSLHQPRDLELKLKQLAGKLVRDTQGHPGRTLTLTVKSVDFRVSSKAVTLPTYISALDDIVHHGTLLLRSLYPLKLRLMGLRLSGLAVEGSRDLALRQQTIHQFIRKNPQEFRPANMDSAEPAEDQGDLIDLSDHLDSDTDIELEQDSVLDTNHTTPVNLCKDRSLDLESMRPDLVCSLPPSTSSPSPAPAIKPVTFAAALRQRNQIPILNQSRVNTCSD